MSSVGSGEDTAMEFSSESQRRELRLVEAWREVLPPVRPSRDVQKIFTSAFVHEVHRLPAPPRCLLMGATPELRSLVHRYGCPLTCVDRDEAMLHGLEALVDPKGPRELVCGDWLAIDVETTMDVVLGDGVINMLPLDRHQDLLEVIARALTPGGLAIMRTAVRKPPSYATPEALFCSYRSGARTLPVFTATNIHLRMLWLHERQTRWLDHQSYFRYVADLNERGVLTDAEFRPYRELHESGGGIDVGYVDMDTFEALAGERFKVEGTRYAEDFSGSEYNPVYLLRKRN